MSARQLLDQLLQSGQGLARDASARVQSASAGGNAPSFLAGLGGGALGAGALGLLMGSKKARKIGGKVAMYGGMAALGALAYRAYGDWQRKQAQAPGQAPQTLDRLPPAQAEQHSSAILAAMIGAAKADGHIGPEERQLLESELGKLSAEAADRRWLETELARPLDPAAVAAAAQTPEMAAEMYLASLLVVDEESYMERAYLDELARQLKLAPDLKAQLEAQVKTPA
ncbi:tellurite resistance TerB family protein [Bordetella petrii]|uniref:tellurite resistance TerB family protein n=1 Tax=Bordetella petrii TaxID=94624 RepID=UPI001A95C49D|nr:tellurite resistance TerB family protein [Bordetella petrii]MBO1111270.1 tellurite resistance TerB family protein [Bordetella petrii]